MRRHAPAARRRTRLSHDDTGCISRRAVLFFLAARARRLMTYNIRLVAIAKNGEGNDQLTTPGPDAIIDTAATGCTPKPKRRCIIS
jgi:hypothetical protein